MFGKPKLIHWLAGFSLLAGSLCLEAATNPLPNIVFILGDDIGWADVGRYHQYYTNTVPPVPTPNLNRLCDEGMMFTDAQLPASLCAPNRFCLQTGNYPWRSRLGGSWNATGPSAFFYGAVEDDRINNPHRTIGQMLQPAGYRTAYFGKMHFGSDFFDSAGNLLRNLNGTNNAQIDFSRPFTNGMRDHGYDYTFVNPSGIQGPLYAWFENDAWRPVSDFQSEVNGVAPGAASTLRVFLKGQTVGHGKINDDGYGDSRFDTSEHGPILSHFATKFIGDHVTNHPGQPFMIYYATPAIHVPITPSTNGYIAAGSTGIGDRADFLADLDTQIGILLAKLDTLGIASNTIVIFTGDNGGWFPLTDPQVLAGQCPSGPLRGMKSSIYEGGHRVPFIWRWGDGSTNHSVIPPGKVCTQLVSPIDWVPTLLNLLGQTVKIDQHQDSVEMLSLLVTNNPDAQPAVRDRVLHQLADGSEAVRLNDAAGHWFYLRPNPPAPMELYELTSDIGQTTNLVAGYTNLADLPTNHLHRARLEAMETWFFAHDTAYETRTTLAFNYAAGVAAPMDLTAVETAGQAILNWSAAVGATRYHVKRATAPGGPYTKLATNITALTCTNTAPPAGTKYYFVVSAANALGESADSSEVSIGSARYLWTGGASGDWSVAGNWNPADPLPSATDTEVCFSQTAAGNLTNYLKTARTLRSLTFTNTAAGDIEIQQTTTLGGGTAAIMTCDGGGAGASLTIAPGVVANISIGGGAGNTRLGDHLVITHNGSGLLNFNRQFTDGPNGPRSVTKNGAGMMTWSGASGFTGGTILNAGTLNINSSGALGKGPLTITGGTIDNTSAGGTVTLANTNAHFWNAGFTYTGTKWLNLGTGPVTLGANLVLTASAGQLTVGGPVGGDFTLTKNGGGALQLNSSASSYTGGTVQNGAGKLILGANNVLGAGPLTISNSSGIILSTGIAARSLNNAVVFAAGHNLGDATDTGALTFTGGITVNSALRTLAVKSDVIFSGAVGGSGGITKAGAGRLFLNGSTTAALGVTVNAGTLAGSGVITGPVGVATNATLLPGRGGADTAPLAISNRLTLAAGSTTIIAVNRTNASPAATLTGITTLTNGGTLTVTNVGPALTGGEVFPLFRATSVSGAFAATNLPALAGGLSWLWLNNGTTLAVAGANENRWQSASAVINDAIVLTHRGFAGCAVVMESATNLTPPVVWLPVVTNVVATNGLLNFTNNATAPLNFFRTRYLP